MSAGTAGLLAGLLIAPGALLWVGHRFRDRSRRMKRAFWGGVAGYGLGVVATLAGSMLPPVLWEGGWRGAVVHWSLLCGASVGGIVGGSRGGRRGEPPAGRDPGHSS